MFEPRKIEPGERLNTRQRLVVLCMNVLLLTELTLGMYFGQQDPENLTAVFLRIFIPSAAITLLAARLVMRRLQPVD